MSKLNYEVKAVLLKNVALAQSCQRCGKPSDGAYCDEHTPPKATVFNGYKRKVTTNGCDVFVNGVFDHKEPTAFRAELCQKAMEKSFAKLNFRCNKLGLV